MTRKTSNLSAGDYGRIGQYNDLREESRASSYLLAYEQDTPDLTLKVSPGNVYFGNTLVEFAGGNSPSFTAPTSNPRIDLLYLDSDGVLQRLAGDEGATPVAPGLAGIPICYVYNVVGQTSIKDEDDSSNGYIQKDLRQFVKKGIKPTIQTYTANDTWTKPAGLTYIEVELVGAGGGGGGNAGNGSGGNASNFGSHLGANGGGAGGSTTDQDVIGAGGAGVNGDLNISGGSGSPTRIGGSNNAHPGDGGASLLGFGGIAPRYGNSSGSGGQVYGGAGSGCYQVVAGTTDRGGAGGGGGGYSRKVILADDLGANETVTVGVGGAGGSGTYSGGNGANGVVIVKEYYV